MGQSIVNVGQEDLADSVMAKSMTAKEVDRFVRGSKNLSQSILQFRQGLSIPKNNTDTGDVPPSPNGDEEAVFVDSSEEDEADGNPKAQQRPKGSSFLEAGLQAGQEALRRLSQQSKS